MSHFGRKTHIPFCEHRGATQDNARNTRRAGTTRRRWFRTCEKSVRFKMIDNCRILLSNANLLKCCSEEPPRLSEHGRPPSEDRNHMLTHPPKTPHLPRIRSQSLFPAATLGMFLLLAAPVPAMAQMPGVTPVCDRTPEVRDEIVRRIPGVSDCADVTEEHLAAFQGSPQSLRSLQRLFHWLPRSDQGVEGRGFFRPDFAEIDHHRPE